MDPKRFDLVDSELVGPLDAMPDLSNLSDATLAGIRARLSGPAPLPHDPAKISITDVDIPGNDAPSIRGRLYRPSNPSGVLPALLNIHGGGFVVGNLLRDEELMRSLCLELGCTALSIDYRLAPETCFPGPTEDCLAALTWLHQNAEQLGIDASKIALRGASAGGGLAAGAVLLNRDRARIPVKFMLLVYPMLDDRTGAPAIVGKHVWTPPANRYGWGAFLGAGRHGTDASAYAVPARSEDLSGFPPTFIAVGSIDLFVFEDIDFARRLLEAGVPTELHVYPGAYHSFNLIPQSAVARAFERDSRAALRRGWLMQTKENFR